MTDPAHAWQAAKGGLWGEVLAALVLRTSIVQGPGTDAALVDAVATPQRSSTELAVGILSSQTLYWAAGYRTFPAVVRGLAPFLPAMSAAQAGHVLARTHVLPQVVLCLSAAGLPLPAAAPFQVHGPMFQAIERHLSTAHARVALHAWRGRVEEAFGLDSEEAEHVLTGGTTPRTVPTPTS